MAREYSSRFLQRLALPHHPALHARIFLYHGIRRFRMLMRYVCGRRVALPKSKAVDITADFETTQKKYQEEHWAWIENIFPNDFWEDMVTHWPPRYFFESPQWITKSYDYGFKWNQGEPLPPHIEKFPELHAFFLYLQSDGWSARIRAYIGSDKNIVCNSFLLNMTHTGSSVIPHKDDPLPENESPFINMIFCIDGTGGGDSGELMLSHDPDQDDIFFTPPTLKNACLVYDTESDFYHGFPPVARGKRRLAITASFSPKQEGI